jgi:DNA-binding PadR family transcriptional regulator
MKDAMLALLAKEPAHGYELRQQLIRALGSAGEALNPGQIYVTLSRLQKSGLVEARQIGQASQPDRKVYELTAAGRERVAEWLTELAWPKVAPAEFHLKLVAAAATGLADPVALIDAQRRELLRQLSQLQQAALAEPARSPAVLLLEGASLRMQADIRWLELCEQRWTERRPT